MSHPFRSLSAGALLIALVVGSALSSGVVRFDFAASDHHGGGETEFRIQARQTESGRVEVRAQARMGADEWTTHTPDARFLPIPTEPGKWYSSNVFAVGESAAAPDISDPGAYTQFYVAEAVDYYERYGLTEMLRYYNSAESMVGQWYLFAYDENDTYIAHRIASRLGQSAGDIVGPDGYPIPLVLIGAATEEGSWVDYLHVNAETGAVQLKHSWVVRHDGIVLGSGWYEDGPSREHAPGAFAQSFVERALAMYQALGREATLEHYNSPESVDGEWYVSIYELDGTRLAHPYLPIGGNLLDGGPDVTGRHFREEFIAIEDRGWVGYVFLNPDSGEQEQKHTWVVRHDGLLFASGWYEAGVVASSDGGS